MIETITGAKKIEDNENWRNIFDAHNDSVDAHDEIASDLAYIVHGNKCASAVAVGQYVLLMGSTISGLSDGAYKAAKAITANTAIDSTYLTAVSGGIANELNSNLTKINSSTLQSCAGKSAIKTYLESVIGTMSSGESKLLRIVNTDTSFAIMEYNQYYEGYAFCTYTNGSSNKNVVWIGYNSNGKSIVFAYNQNTWKEPYMLPGSVVELSVTDVFTAASGFSFGTGSTVKIDGKRIIAKLYFSGSITTTSDGRKVFATINTAYRPTTTQACGCIYNSSTTGNQYTNGAVWIGSSGNVSLATGEVSKTYGSTSYPWATSSDGIYVSWEII